MITAGSEFYIEPNIYFYTSFDEAIKVDSYWTDKKCITIDEILKQKQQYRYVIGDPGYGKTRLMQELALKDLNAFYIDLKKLRNTSIVEFIENKQSIDCKNLTAADISKKGYYKNNKFNLNTSSNITLYLDAVDEIAKEFFSVFVDNLDYFADNYTNCNIILSGRTHNINDIKNILPKSNSWSFIKIDKFYGDQITKYIKKFIPEITDESISKLLGSTSTVTLNYFQFSSSILQIPRYLKLGIELLSEDKELDLSKITRLVLFDRFIKGKLNKERTNIKHIDTAFILKFLSQLALVMEIKQTSQLTKDEFVIILDELQSDIKSFIFNTLSPDEFFRYTLLKDNVDTIEFENSEFQEYLAATEMFTFDSIEQVTYDLCYISEVTDFNTSWYNTLSYVIEKHPYLLKNITNRQIATNNISYNFMSFLLANIKEENANKIETKDKKHVFCDILQYHLRNNRELPMRNGANLGLLYNATESDLFDILKECKEDGNHTGIASILMLLPTIYSKNRNILIEKKELIFNICYENKGDKNIMDYGLPVLAIFKDEDLIKEFEFVFENITNESKTFIGAFFRALDVINDHNLKVEYILKYYRLSKLTFSSPFNALLSILNNSESVLKLMEGFASSQDAFVNFIESIEYKSPGLKDQIEKVIIEDKEILKPVEIIIYNIIKSEGVNNSLVDNDFLSFLVKRAVDRNPSFSVDIIKKIIKQPYFQIYKYEKIISNLLHKDNIAACVGLLKKSNNQNLLNNVFYICEKANPEIFKLRSNYIEEQPVIQIPPDNTSMVLKTFQEKLWVDGDMFMLDVFEYYGQHYEEIEKEASKEEKERFISLLKTTLQHSNVDSAELTVNDKETNSRNYTWTTTDFFHSFGSIVQIPNIKEIVNIDDYRNYFLAFITLTDHVIAETLYELLKPLTEADINKLKTFFKTEDDRNFINMRTFLSFIEKFEIVEALPILKSFIENDKDKFDPYELTEILKTIWLFDKNDQYYLSIVENVDSEQHNDLWFYANAILIEGFEDINAIKARCEVVKQRKFEYVKPITSYSPRGMANIIPNNVSELHHFSFASSLLKISSPNFMDIYLDLLNFSIDIENDSSEYQEYANYTRGIVSVYFKNLKKTKNYTYIEQLEKCIETKNAKEQCRWFLDEIRTEFVEYIESNNVLSYYIKKYNKQKEKKYIDISTAEDLNRVIEDALNIDLRKWIELEGAYKMIRDYRIEGAKRQTTEDLMQKTMASQFENILLKKGLRKFDIYREVQQKNDKRTDFLIKYGFIENVMIEIKRANNTDFCSGKNNYKTKLEGYLTGTNSKYGFYVIFNDSKRKDKFQKEINEHRELYKGSQIAVIGIDCMINSKGEL